MINYANMPGKPRRDLHVFYILDTSGSMRGLSISTLNQAMRESMVILRDVARNNGDARIKVSVLEFNSYCRWMQPNGPEDMEDFMWSNLEAGGLTCMGAALKELNSKLSKDAFLRSSTGLYMPVLIFMTDGFANDDYEGALAETKENHLFKGAIKIGFAIGEDADFNMIEKVVDSPKAVIRTTDLDKFAEMLRFVTESATTLSITPDGMGVSLSDEVVRRARRHVGLDVEEESSDGETSANDDVTFSWDAVDVHSWDFPDL